MDACRKLIKLEDVLSEKEVDYVIREILGGEEEWRVISSEVKPAAEGMTGFLGDHLRVTLDVAAGDSSKTIRLFVKRLPAENQEKVDFIAEYNFYKKEAMAYQLLQKLQNDGDGVPWCVKTLLATDSIVVMPDMQPLGYANSTQKILDLPHLLVTAASVARFHAATTNYEKNKVLRNNNPWTFSQEYADLFVDHQFNAHKGSPFLRTSAKVTANILKTFSAKYKDTLDLESKIYKLFVQASHSLREHENTLNVILHKDLWTANILFRYEEGAPVNALLIDYQCMSYGPPAIDLLVLLYCTTLRSFREQHESIVLRHYYSVYIENLEDKTKQKLIKLGYDEKEFLLWCEKTRMFALAQALSFAPFFLTDAITAQQVYNDPKTFKELFYTDRTRPVVEYCEQNPSYLVRLLDISEEFVERYLDK